MLHHQRHNTYALNVTTEQLVSSFHCIYRSNSLLFAERSNLLHLDHTSLASLVVVD